MAPRELVDELAALSLAVEHVAVERLERAVADGTVRRTALVRLRGAGEEGLGEEVTFQPDDLLQPGDERLRDVLEAGRPRTLGELWELLDGADLCRRPPRFDVVRSYRRWAVEAAALDLALRQAGSSLPQAVGRELQPLRFVVSPPRSRLRAFPGLGLKLDAADVEPGLPVEIVDFKGEDEVLLDRVLALYPAALLEDPPRVPPGARISWDVPVRSASDLDRLAPPAAVNVKPARVGSVTGVLRLYEACRQRGVALYGGGQWELGPGRGQAQLLASLFHADAPNDLAPAAYNDASLASGLPGSPLTLEAARGFRAAS